MEEKLEDITGPLLIMSSASDTLEPLIETPPESDQESESSDPNTPLLVENGDNSTESQNGPFASQKFGSGNFGSTRGNSKKKYRPMKRGVNTLQLMMITYFNTCGGPFGVEPAVEAAGPLWTLIALIVLPLFWSLPQAIMSAELSLLVNENGGNVVWVQRAFGNFWSWVNAFNNLGNSFSSMTLLVILLVEYLPYEFTWWQGWLIKIAFVWFVAFLNIVGLRLISRLSMFLAFAIISPFIAMIICVLIRGGEDWGSIFVIPPAKYYNWSLFFSTLVWSYGGFDTMGALAGEVKGGKSTFIMGIMGSFPLILANYFAPIYFGYFINPHYKQWHAGYFTDLAYMLSNWLGIWMVIASFISNFGSFNTTLATLARVIWSMAKMEGDKKLLPKFLSWSWQRHTGTVRPIAAVIATAVATSLLSLMEYNWLVQVFLVLRVLNLGLEYAALIRLRYTEPDAPRPFKAPGGLIGAWSLGIPSLFIAAFTIYSANWVVWVTGVAFNAVVFISYPIVQYIRKRLRESQALIN